MKDQVTIGLIGFGTIGSGTFQLFHEHRKEVEARVGAKVRLKSVCSLSPIESPYLTKDIHVTKDWKELVEDPQIDCIVELIGGTEPARTIVTTALKNNKHVVTANKAILSKFWNEIFGMAHSRRRLVYFEAAVGGGIPVIQALNEGLAANKINRITGILNGTTNFILTKMQESGRSYDVALREAQHAGFAEANPAFDVDGIDAAQKISILGSLAAGAWISPDHVYTEGITDISQVDIRLIQERLHSSIKLLGIAEKKESGWCLRVHPTLISKYHPFANVRNEYNAISIHGNAVGDVMFYGKGAGKRPTSSAVLSDIIFLCRHVANWTAEKLPYVVHHPHATVPIANMNTVRGKYYLRATTVDKPGVLSRITGVLGKHHVSIASVHQDVFQNRLTKKGIPVILLTHDSSEQDIQKSIKAIDSLDTTRSKTVMLRMS